MIKLIASDLDGTLLLDGKQTISNEMYDIIRELKKKDILFVAASGRQYPNLKRLFEPVSDDIAFISENGALVMYKDKVISKNILEKQLGLSIADDILMKENCEVVVSGEKTCYLQPKTEEFLSFIRDGMENKFTIVDKFTDIEEEFLKISMYSGDGVEGNLASYFTNRWGKQSNIAVSGFEWLDFNHITASKGEAIGKLQDLFGIKREESMAFGDNFNDIHMLQGVYFSYAMKNAKQAIKEVSKFETEKVEHTLLALLEKLN